MKRWIIIEHFLLFHLSLMPLGIRNIFVHNFSVSRKSRFVNLFIDSGFFPAHWCGRVEYVSTAAAFTPSEKTVTMPARAALTRFAVFALQSGFPPRVFDHRRVTPSSFLATP